MGGPAEGWAIRILHHCSGEGSQQGARRLALQRRRRRPELLPRRPRRLPPRSPRGGSGVVMASSPGLCSLGWDFSTQQVPSRRRRRRWRQQLGRLQRAVAPVAATGLSRLLSSSAKRARSRETAPRSADPIIPGTRHGSYSLTSQTVFTWEGWFKKEA